MLVLDDLHWSDGASIELIAALLRRGPDAPVLLALAFRPGQAPERLSAALAAPAVARVELGQLSEAEAAELLGELDAKALADIYRHGGGNPFYLEQLARASDAGRLSGALRHAGDGAATPAACPAPWRPRSPRSSSRCRCSARALLERRGGGRRAVRARPRGRGRPSSRTDEGLAALDDLLDRDLVRPTQVPREFIFRHPLVRRAVYESTRGGWRLAAHARAAEALGARGAAATERAHHVEQSAGQGDEEAIAVLLEAGEATAAARAGRRGALVRGGAAPAPGGRPRAPGRAARRAGLGAAVASGSSSAAARPCSRRSSCCPRSPRSGGVELTALCAAVEHWLGRHDEAHAPAHARVGGPARRARRRRGRGAADRAGGRRPLRAGLRADARDGRRRARGRARGSGDRALIASAAVGARPRRGGAGRDRGRARAPRGGAGADRSALRRRAGPAARGALLPRLGRELPRALRRRDRARRPRHRDRAGHRRGTAARADDAREGLPVRDAGQARRGDRAVRGGGRVDAAVGQPPLPVLGAVRARLRALPPGRPRRGDRGVRGERARGRAHGGRHDAGRRRRARPGCWLRPVRARRAGPRLRDHARLSAARRSPQAIPVERCFNWETLGPGGARPRAARGGRGLRAPRRGARRDASTCTCPRPWRTAPGRRSCSHAGDAAAAAARGRRRPPTAARPPARGCRRRSPAASQGQALAAAGERKEAVADAARGRARARRAAARTACATRCAASCASSAPAPRPAGRATARGLGRRGAHQARARDRRRWSPTA